MKVLMRQQLNAFYHSSTHHAFRQQPICKQSWLTAVLYSSRTQGRLRWLFYFFVRITFHRYYSVCARFLKSNITCCIEVISFRDQDRRRILWCPSRIGSEANIVLFTFDLVYRSLSVAISGFVSTLMIPKSNCHLNHVRLSLLYSTQLSVRYPELDGCRYF